MLRKICTLVLMPLLVLVTCPMQGFSAEDAPQMSIRHNPVEEVVAGKRIPLDAKLQDDAGIKLARVYFKAEEAKDYSFINLHPTDDVGFLDDVTDAVDSVGTKSEIVNVVGELPAPANGAGSFEYLILVLNGNDLVVKSQTYVVKVEDDQDAGTAVAENEPINVYTELSEAPSEVTGFSDNITVDVIESAAKLGVVAGLYSSLTTGGSSAAATAGGTVTASAGYSTAVLVTGAVVATAAVVGVAAASGGGGGSSSGGGGGDVTSRNVTICVTDSNAVQDDYYNLYVNNSFIGAVNNPPGGTTCHNATLRSGSNLIELRLTRLMGASTYLTITINPGGWSNEFYGSTNHSWTVTAP